MIKPEWGVKRSCPKCATRFYDLTRDDPVTCIACGNAWVPDPVLKSKAPMAFEQAKPAAQAEETADAVLGDEDLDLEEEEAAVDTEDGAELGGDDDIAEVVDERGEEER